MTSAEQRYHGMTLRIACTMLIFYGLMTAQSVVLVLASFFTASLNAVAAEVVTEVLSAVLYAAIFMLPIFFFKKLPSKTPAEPMRLSLTLPKNALFYVVFGVAANSALAYLNAQFVSIFHYSEFSEEVLWQTDITSNYQLVLLFLSLAVVPAFVEEFLFRGLILENLLPYGRTTAIFASAFLFGLMHQNAEQFLYATLSGVVLGWIYVRTRSIWVCVLMHFFNNFQSVLQTAVIERLPEATANVVLYCMEGGILLLGILAGVMLFRSDKSRQREMRAAGAFERELTKDAEYTDYPISLSRRIKLFFNVPMIIFVAWCLANMLLLIMMSLAMH